MPPCSKCKDVGTLEIDGKLVECECAQIKRIALAMPPHIRKADVLKGHLELSVLRDIDKNLFIIASWLDVKAIIKAIMIKYPAKFIKVTSDREIRDVFVGSRSSATKAKMDISEEDAANIYNNLQDLMHNPDLMIVRTNELSYKNKAASGAFEEAISYRVDRDRPTWVISELERPFGSGSHAWSESVALLLATDFKRVMIQRITPKPTNEESYFSPEPVAASSGMGNQKEKPVKKETPTRESPKVPKEEKKIQSVPDDDGIDPSLAMFGRGVSKSKKFQGRE